MEFLSAFWQSLPAPLLVYQIAVTLFAAFTLINAAADWFYFRRPGVGSPLPRSLSKRPSPSEGRGGTDAEEISSPLVPPLPSEGEGRLESERGRGLPTPNAQLPSVSVLIPARNEEANIGACVKSLLAQKYPGSLEILVLDDRSEDETAKAVWGMQSAWYAPQPTLKLLHGGDVLPGWKGKPNALRQLAAEATGELLLLTDADCIFAPGAITAAVAFKEEMRADSLSLIPFLECRSFWENVLIPLQYFLIFATLPVKMVSDSPNPAFAASNGAFILISAETYAALGGHSAVRGEMAEDVLFARHVKRSGYRLVYGDGAAVYKVRMYPSFREIWDGFSKNLFSAMGKSVPIVAVWSAFALTTQVFPFLFLAVSLLSGNYSLVSFTLPLIQVALSLGIRTALAFRFRNALWAVPTHPLGWLVFAAIALRSAYRGVSGKGHSWKGRIYQ